MSLLNFKYDYDFGWGPALECPAGCGDYATHLDKVLVLTASGRSLVVEAYGEDTESDIKTRTMTLKDPGRRHSITIEGSCEVCGARFQIRFRQHKGTTFTAVVIGDKKPSFDSEVERLYWETASSQLKPLLGPKGLECQYQIGNYRMDFAVPSLKIGIEVDGLAYHNGQTSFVRDRKRQRWIEEQGWRVIRFAAIEVMDNAEECVAATKRMIVQLLNQSRLT